MPRATSKLPRWLAAAGVVVSVALVEMWWAVGELGLLAEHQVSAGHWVSSPWLPVVTNMTFILCPPEFPLGFASMDMSGSGQLVAWAIAAALNGVLYYWMGRGIVALRERWRRRPAGKGTHNP